MRDTQSPRRRPVPWRALWLGFVVLLFGGCVHGYVTPFVPGPEFPFLGASAVAIGIAFGVSIAFVATMPAQAWSDHPDPFTIALAATGILWPVLSVLLAFVLLKSMPSLWTAANGAPVVEVVVARPQWDESWLRCPYYVISDELATVSPKICANPEVYAASPDRPVSVEVHGRRSRFGLRVERVAVPNASDGR
jgi:hypothetical protein